MRLIFVLAAARRSRPSTKHTSKPAKARRHFEHRPLVAVIVLRRRGRKAQRRTTSRNHQAPRRRRDVAPNPSSSRLAPPRTAARGVAGGGQKSRRSSTTVAAVADDEPTRGLAEARPTRRCGNAGDSSTRASDVSTLAANPLASVGGDSSDATLYRSRVNAPTPSPRLLANLPPDAASKLATTRCCGSRRDSTTLGDAGPELRTVGAEQLAILGQECPTGYQNQGGPAAIADVQRGYSTGDDETARRREQPASSTQFLDDGRS